MWTSSPYRRTRRGVGIRVSIESDVTPLTSHYSTCLILRHTYRTERPFNSCRPHSCPWLDINSGGNDQFKIRNLSSPICFVQHDEDRMNNEAADNSLRLYCRKDIARLQLSSRQNNESTHISSVISPSNKVLHCRTVPDLHCRGKEITTIYMKLVCFYVPTDSPGLLEVAHS